MRSTLMPRSTSFSQIQSTAMLLCAQTRTWLSRISVSLIASTRVVVLPVPGGPWTIATSLARNTSFTARSCVSLSQGNDIGAKVKRPATNFE